MIKTVLKYVAIGMVVLLVGLWLWAGGFSQIVRFVKTIPNPIDIIWGTSTSTYQVVLPWQLPIPQGSDITDLTEEGARYERDIEEERLNDLQGQYSDLEAKATRQRETGPTSPYAGSVSLSIASASESDAADEYLVVEARGGSSASIQISGWSLQSMLTGKRAIVPLGASVYILGSLNSVRPVTLEPGTSAIVTTGFSPAGVSFRENRCTGYLSQNQSYEPPLANACPSPSESMPLNSDNLQRYGGDCIDHVRTIPQCTFTASIPENLSPACRSYIANTFSYNGCVQSRQADASFALDTWRIYLGHADELWSNSHDVIRLLDQYGQTVDSVTY